MYPKSTTVPHHRLVTLTNCHIVGSTMSCPGNQYDGASIHTMTSDPTPGWIRVTIANAPGVAFRVRKNPIKKNPCGCGVKFDTNSLAAMQNSHRSPWVANPPASSCRAGTIRNAKTGRCDRLSASTPAVSRILAAQARRQMYRNIYNNPASQRELLGKAQRSAIATQVRRAIDRQFAR